MGPDKGGPKDFREDVPLEEAREEILALVDSLETYQSESDKSRVVVAIITPMIVRQGFLLAHNCPTIRVIGPAGAKERIQAVLEGIYGEQAESGCRIL